MVASSAPGPDVNAAIVPVTLAMMPMNTVRGLPVLLLAVLLFGAGACGADQSAHVARPAVRVMSFNIRYGTAKDGEDSWDKRRDFLVERVRAYTPDLLGMQEVLAEQADFLQERLPEYGFAGAGRDDGKRKGEYSPVMFRKDRFELLAHGQWWLSPTPEVVGSKGWDAALPRIVTWARLKDRAGGTTLLWFNTHWDHQGNTARVESGKLMRRLIVENRGDPNLPTIVTGDFNSSEDTPQYRTLTVGDGTGLKLIDAYRETHPQRQPDEASFNGFKGTRQGSRIDWILHSPQWLATGAAIDRTDRNGHTPSDHYPVTAELELKK
jgi:endonuclease/exonuclease/phosphatase family metal-dependent hydrolase